MDEDTIRIIKEKIKQKYGNLKACSEAAGVKYTTLRDMLNGNILKSNVENVLKLCNALEIPIEMLIENFDPLEQLPEILEELESWGYSYEIDMDKNFEIAIRKLNGSYDYYNIYTFVENYYPYFRKQYMQSNNQKLIARKAEDLNEEQMDAILKMIDLMIDKNEEN